MKYHIIEISHLYFPQNNNPNFWTPLYLTKHRVIWGSLIIYRVTPQFPTSNYEKKRQHFHLVLVVLKQKLQINNYKDQSLAQKRKNNQPIKKPTKSPTHPKQKQNKNETKNPQIKFPVSVCH